MALLRVVRGARALAVLTEWGELRDLDFAKVAASCRGTGSSRRGTISTLSLRVADVSREVPVEGHVDAVLHLASPPSPSAHSARPFETLAAGSEGTRRPLELAVRTSAHFVLASTSGIYGDPAVHPRPEHYRDNVVPVGAHSVDDGATRFAQALTVHGDGTQTRSLCHVDDLVDGLLGLLESEVVGPLNLGNPDERSVGVARIVLDLTGSRAGVEHLPRPTDDPKRRCPDMTRARRALGCVPSTTLDDGLSRTGEWFRSRLAGSGG